MGESATAFIRLRLEREGDGFMLGGDHLEANVQQNVRTVVNESDQDA
jgi:hypothetical protein